MLDFRNLDPRFGFYRKLEEGRVKRPIPSTAHTEGNLLFIHQPLVHARALSGEQNRFEQLQRIIFRSVRLRHVVRSHQERKLSKLADYEPTLALLLGFLSGYASGRSARGN